MNAEQKYGEVIKELGDVMSKKNNEIVVLRFKIDDLTRLLTAAEKRINELMEDEKT